MKPSQVLQSRKTEILQVISRYNVANPRVFGSVLHGTDKDGSDLDILVDAGPGMGLAFFKLEGELENLLGLKVDLVTPGFLHKLIRDEVLAEAKPL